MSSVEQLQKIAIHDQMTALRTKRNFIKNKDGPYAATLRRKAIDAQMNASRSKRAFIKAAKKEESKTNDKTQKEAERQKKLKKATEYLQGVETELNQIYTNANAQFTQAKKSNNKTLARQAKAKLDESRGIIEEYQKNLPEIRTLQAPAA